MAQVTDDDTPVLDNGRLTVAITQGATSLDGLSIANTGGAETNITLVGENQVYFGTNAIGILTVVTNGTNVLAVDFNTNATLAAVQTMLRAVTFSNSATRGVPVNRTLEFILTDGRDGISTPVELELEILPFNHAPVPANDEATTTADAPIALLIPKLLGNDHDADGDLLSFSLAGSITEQRGMVEIYNDKVLYVPDPGLVGTDTFVYRVTDPYGAFSEAVVSVNVKASQGPSTSIVWVKPVGDGTIQVKMLGIPNRSYTVQWSFDLLYWTFLQKVTAKANGEIDFEDHPTDTTMRFYRILYP